MPNCKRPNVWNTLGTGLALGLDLRLWIAVRQSLVNRRGERYATIDSTVAQAVPAKTADSAKFLELRNVVDPLSMRASPWAVHYRRQY